MSIRSVTYYQAACDKCGHVDDGGEFSAWVDPDQARMAALDCGWTELEVRVPDTESGPSIYAVIPGGPGSGNPTHRERSILLCEDHTGDGVTWCARCEDDLDESAWTLNPTGELVQKCPNDHLNTITIKELS